MSEEYTDKKLAEIQDELMKQLDKEQMNEDEIEEKSEQVAKMLLKNPVVKIDIAGQIFTLKYKIINSKKQEGKKSVDIRVILLIVANDAKVKLLGTKYIPFTANAEIIEHLSMEENLRGVVDAFIRHITGNVKPEVLD